MDALVLEQKGVLRLRDMAIDEPLGPDDVRLRIPAAGIGGSDLHHYQPGAIGRVIVRATKPFSAAPTCGPTPWP